MDPVNLASVSAGASVIAASGATGEFRAGNVLDNDERLIWYVEGELPQWFVVQLGGPRAQEVRSFGWYCWHNYVTNPRRVRLLVSRSGRPEDFALWCAVEAEQRAGLQLFGMPALPPEYRFVRVEVTDTFANSTKTYMNRFFLYREPLDVLLLRRRQLRAAGGQGGMDDEEEEEEVEVRSGDGDGERSAFGSPQGGVVAAPAAAGARSSSPGPVVVVTEPAEESYARFRHMVLQDCRREAQAVAAELVRTSLEELGSRLEERLVGVVQRTQDDAVAAAREAAIRAVRDERVERDAQPESPPAWLLEAMQRTRGDATVAATEAAVRAAREEARAAVAAELAARPVSPPDPPQSPAPHERQRERQREPRLAEPVHGETPPRHVPEAALPQVQQSMPVTPNERGGQQRQEPQRADSGDGRAEADEERGHEREGRMGSNPVSPVPWEHAMAAATTEALAIDEAPSPPPSTTPVCQDIQALLALLREKLAAKAAKLEQLQRLTSSHPPGVRGSTP